jgi:iron complex outermembrane receptor protein
VLSAVGTGALAQDDRAARAGALEEIIVTATRVETNLQETPMSIAAFTGENLELAGIETGRELGIMVPNVVINPGATGEFFASMVFRGLPGVTSYFDGMWFSNVGFLQRSFVELERVEVLRGPQGTLFGRNSNGGAVQVITRRPAEEFGARLDLEIGEFDERMVAIGVDAPFADRVQTKWTAAYDRNDGFVESRSAPFALGDYENWLLRADVLWEPSENLSLRFNVNRENREGSPARIVRMSNPNRPVQVAYNVLAGNPDFLAQARAVNPAFPDPPFALAAEEYTAQSHAAGFPGGIVGQWQTRTTTHGPTSIDQRWAALTIEWGITDRLTLESLSGYIKAPGSWINDPFAAELTIATELDRNHAESTTQELHLLGSHFNGRLRSFLGLYYLNLEVSERLSNWSWWEFAIPNTGPNPGIPGPPGVGGRPSWNQAAVDYVRSWGATVGDPTLAIFQPLTFFTTDRLFRAEDTDRAFFGQLTVGLIDKLDLTLGFRFTEDDGGFGEYLPADSFRPVTPGTVPPGDPYAVASVIQETERGDLGTVSTPRVSIEYRPTDEMFIYASYAEGFTSGAIINDPRLPAPYELDPEVVATKEIGLRSDWIDGRLRFNVTAFDSLWDGLRVPKLVPDPNAPVFIFVQTSDGVAEAQGLELEVLYAPGDRWDLNFGLGLLDTEYLEIGNPPPNGTGLQPGIPLAYAPEVSYALGARYRWPLRSGGALTLVGNYGWMDEYQRDAANQFQSKKPDGSNNPEPSYGILNARVIYQPANRNWQLSLFGTNLTDEWYVNGGLAARLQSGVDMAMIGRPREVGVGMRFVFD